MNNMFSNQPIIFVRALSYSYAKDQRVLKQLGLEVPEAAVYGFLGANGAGKSTTIRAMLGLLRPEAGRIELFGQDLYTHRRKILKRVGALIEAPSIYLHLSGYDNLKIACKYLNVSTARIDEVLHLVNLHRHGRKISRKYSTGMKQRLGLAMALLHDPDLLILDEPTNGLDPTGIIEIRNIVERLRQQGKTIFLSSHLLSEIEKIATQVGILKNGEMIFQGAIEELEQLRITNLEVQLLVSDASLANDLLADEYKVRMMDRQKVVITVPHQEVMPEIISRLVAGEVRLYEATTQKNDLEKLFIDITEESNK